MQKNMGTFDRIIRLILVAGIVVLYLSGMISGIQALVLGILAVILLVTCLFSYCPLYVPLKISTRKKPSGQYKK
jgi:hypothetical protein